MEYQIKDPNIEKYYLQNWSWYFFLSNSMVKMDINGVCGVVYQLEKHVFTPSISIKLSHLYFLKNRNLKILVSNLKGCFLKMIKAYLQKDTLLNVKCMTMLSLNSAFLTGCLSWVYRVGSINITTCNIWIFLKICIKSPNALMTTGFNDIFGQLTNKYFMKWLLQIKV